MVMSENFVVYHFWSQRTSGFEMSVLELYEDTESLERSGKPSAVEAPFSSHTALAPTVLQQTYVFNYPVRALVRASRVCE